MITIKHAATFVLLAMAFSCVPALGQQQIAIPKQTVDQSLRAKLPKEILDAREMVAVNNGSFPPYLIVSDTQTVTGASADLMDALGAILGIKIRHEEVSGLSSVLAGLKANRYQLASGPIGDFPDREEGNDFIDFVQEFVVFAVPKGNPKKIKSLGDTCGKQIAVMAGGSAEKVIKQQADTCAKDGKPALQVQSFTDQPTSMLAVRSNRSDAFFSSQAPLSYFIQQSNGQYELAAVGQKNGFDNLFQGTVVPKGSPLGPVILAGYKKLFENGTYAAIMKKWGLPGNMIKAPGMNLAGTK